MRNFRIITMVVTVLATGVMFVQSVQSATKAYAKNNDARPGWGHGDKNHDHEGSPGASNFPKPGWGHGDDNHEHSGPPGASNFPEPHEDEHEQEHEDD